MAAVLVTGVQPCCLFGKGHCAASQGHAKAREAPRCPHCAKHGAKPDETPAPSKPCDCGDKSVSLAPAGTHAPLEGPVLAPAPAPVTLAAPALLAHAAAPAPAWAAPPPDAARTLPLLL